MTNFSQTLTQLLEKTDLSHEKMIELMQGIMEGKFTAAQIAALLIALRVKGETVIEIAAAAQVMRKLSTKVNVQDDGHLIDTCGTGGDGARTFNVSTASAMVVAAAGAKVAKHGGRSVSSSCGSADVLEKLGVKVNLSPEQVANCVEEIGIGFMFAPNHHSAMKHVAPVRRELRVRTMFNLLGPLTNPANTKNQVIGVFMRDLTSKFAVVLQQLGSSRALVVHGADGMDEISITAPTFVAELNNNHITEYTVKPEDFGLRTATLDDIRVSDVDQAKNMLMGVMNNQAGPARDITILNAAAGIYVAGLANSLAEGVGKAAEVIASGAAGNKLMQLVAVTNG